MEKYIADERTGLKYELVGDYYLIVGEDEPEQEPIGMWGQRHLYYLTPPQNCLRQPVDKWQTECLSCGC